MMGLQIYSDPSSMGMYVPLKRLDGGPMQGGYTMALVCIRPGWYAI